MVEKLKEVFRIPIQAAIDGHHRRETISALRKDITAECYGGDVTCKRQFLDKQKAGKKKMPQFGRADIPQETFIYFGAEDGCVNEWSRAQIRSRR